MPVFCYGNIIWLSLVLSVVLSTNGSLGAERNVTKPDRLYILMMAPFPDKSLMPAWAEGHSLVPAVRLAIEDINNKSDILNEYTLELIESDSGCNASFKAQISLLEHVIHSSKPVVGIVGPGCSEAAQSVAELNRPRGNLQSLGIVGITVATSPLFDNHTKYPFTFGIVSSFAAASNVILRLMQNNQWKNVAVFYETLRLFFSSAYSKFSDELPKKLPNATITLAAGMTDFYIPLQAVKTLGIRLIIVMASANPARNLICLAHHAGMMYPTYQFVFVQRPLSNFLKNHSFHFLGTKYTCTKEMMKETIEGSILTNYNFTSNQPTSVTVSEQTYGMIQSEYSQKVKEYSSEVNMTIDENVYAYPYYDAVWALALSLNKSVDEINWSSSPQNFSVLRNQMYDMTFRGTSGSVSFDRETGHANTIINIQQVSGGEVKLLGHYNAGVIVNISEGSFVSDSFPSEMVTLHLALTLIGLAIATLALALSLCLHLLNVCYRTKAAIKATSPKLNHCIFFGCYLMALAIVILTIQSRFAPTRGTILCNTFQWCLQIGYTLIFGTLLAKSWRLYRIFFYSFSAEKFLSDAVLYCIIIFLVIVDVAICIVWAVQSTVVQMEVQKVYFEESRPVIQVERVCDYNWFVTMEFVYKGILTFTVLCLSIINRRIKQKNFRSSRSVNVLIYTLVLAVGTGLPIYTILAVLRFSVNISYAILCALLATIVFLCLFLLFLPPLLILLTQRFRNYSSIRRLSVLISSH